MLERRTPRGLAQELDQRPVAKQVGYPALCRLVKLSLHLPKCSPRRESMRPQNHLIGDAAIQAPTWTKERVSKIRFAACFAVWQPSAVLTVARHSWPAFSTRLDRV